MLEAEAAAAEGMFDDALTMMENVIKSADPTDSMPIIIQANILMQKVNAPMHTYIYTYMTEDFYCGTIDKNASLYVIFHDLSYGGNVLSASFSLTLIL